MTLALVALAGDGRADDPSTGERPVTVVELVDSPRADLPGRVASFSGTTGPAGDLLRLEGLDMTTPVMVAARAEDPSRPLSIALLKDGWRDPLRRTVTDAEGTSALDFRTYGEVVVELTAATPAGYTLVLWVGPPRPVEMASPFVPPQRAGEPPWLLPAAVTLLVASLAGGMLGAFWLGRRGRRATHA